MYGDSGTSTALSVSPCVCIVDFNRLAASAEIQRPIELSDREARADLSLEYIAMINHECCFVRKVQVRIDAFVTKFSMSRALRHVISREASSSPFTEL